MNQSHLDRLVSCLPAEMQAGFLESVKNYSPDGNDPVEAYFAALAETTRQESTKQREELRLIRQQLAESEQREKLRTENLEKERAENLKAMKNAANSIKGDGIGWRIVTSKLVGTVIFVVVASILANRIIQSKVQTIDPEFHAKIQSLEQRIDGQAQLQNAKIDTIARATQEIETTDKSNELPNYQTLLGKALAIHVFEINENYIMLQITDPKSGKPTQAHYKHFLTPREYEQLRLALKIANKIRTD